MVWSSLQSMGYIRRKKRKPKYDWPDWLSNALKVLKPPERLTVSEWADKFRILDPKTSALPGPWRTSTTPYLQGIMDAFNDPEIEEIIFPKSAQVGGTEALNNILGYVIAQDPGPTLIVYPTLELAEYISRNKLQPMFGLCEELSEKYVEEDSKLLELQFSGMFVVLAGANSPSSLASRAIRYLFLDEVDKYPTNAGKEADPISLARERTKTFPTNKKIFMTSTPTLKSGPIWKAWETADSQYRNYLPCPHCGHFQSLKFSQLKWPENATPEEALRAAYYECEECKGMITDSHKAQMLRDGKWTAEKKNGTRKTAFHINAMYSPWVRFGDVAYEFLKSKDFPDKLMNFINSWLGEPWNQSKARTNSDLVLERQSDHEECEIPEGTLLLTGGVDVQKNYFYYTVRAWGSGMTSWNVTHGIAETWNQIENVMNMQYKDKQGNVYQVNLCGIDSGDQTEEVYDFCAINQEWAVPVKGSSTPLLARYKISTIDKVSSKAHGLRLYIVDGGQYKDMIAGRLNRVNGTGSWMVFAGCDRDYAEQICSEEKVIEKKGGREVEVWRPKGSHTANHYLDAEVYAALAADLLHVRYLPPETEQNENHSEHRQEESSDFIKTDNWIKEKGSWLR